MNKVSVSTLPMDFEKIELELFKISTADYVHVDVMDGKFVSEKTIWLEEMRKIETELIKDVHLMVDKPEDCVEDFISAGADIVTFHFEATKDVQGVIDKIKAKGAKVGISINPETPVSKIKKFIPEISQVLVMSVVPGKGGQGFIEESLDKIKELRALSDTLDICVDGGINDKTGEKCAAAGANILCSGSYIFGFDDPKTGIDILRNV